ncbi:MAG: OmpA family protein, partial [Pseudomonadota bacterium]
MSDITKRYGLPTAALICFTSGCATVDTAFDNDYLDYTTDKVEYIDIEPELGAALPNEDRIRRSLYTSAGLGMSYLTPNTDGAPNVEVDESAAPAGQVTLGLDVNKHFSLEMHSADLGSAGLSPTGRINYHLNGASALYYAGGSRHNRGRRGLSAYGRLGAGAMTNSPVGPVNFNREEEVRPLYGAGLEYNLRSGLGMRAEVISYDTDAQYAQLGLMYRLGQRKRDDIEVVEIFEPATPTVASPIVLPEPAPAETSPVAQAPMAAPVEPIIAAASIPKDTDRDGVLDRRDDCPATVRGSTVDRQGCAVFSGTIEGIQFQPASAELTDEGVDILDDISRTLRDYPRTHLTIKAHTDNRGDADKNQMLSERRARTVVDFLARHGFPYNRMTAKAYGERNPLRSNSTAGGRADNRRVE